jgi:hypothetical protein
MRRLAILAVGALALAGCGGSSKPTTTTTTTAATTTTGTTAGKVSPTAAMQKLIAEDPTYAGTVKLLFDTGDWAVVQSSNGKTAHAVVFRNANGTWVPDRAGKVKVQVLGPQPGTTAPRLPQVAIGITSKLPFVDSGIWVDGKELFEKGGGTATRGTVYGAPAKPLEPGTHVAVGYARNILTGTAVAWTFKTP